MKPRKPLPKLSAKRKVEMKRYRMLKPLFLAENRICFVCECYVEPEKRDLHHWAGRVGALLTYEPMFRMVCRDCHTNIHQQEREARATGMMAPQALWNRPSKVILRTD